MCFGNEFSHLKCQKLKRGRHYYKFIVDGEWKFNPNDEQGEDETGILNNFIDVPRNQESPMANLLEREDELNQRRFQEDFVEESLSSGSEMSQKYANNFLI